MRTWVYPLLLAAVAIFSAEPSNAQSNVKRVMCQGEVKFGSLDSAVGDCGFITNSEVGRTILNVCTGGSQCVVDADLEQEFITRIFGVNLDGASQRNTDGNKSVRFQMPSKQIHCLFVISQGKTEPNGIACDINQSFVRRPVRPRPADCEYDWGQRFELGSDSDAGLECASDWVGADDSPVLAYGETIIRGNIQCSSEQTGLTCKNSKGHGFFLSRQAQKLF